jgi:hypothetical protein
MSEESYEQYERAAGGRGGFTWEAVSKFPRCDHCGSEVLYYDATVKS